MTLTPTPPWDATLALLRWRTTRRGYDADDELLATGAALLQSQNQYAALHVAASRCNVPADRIATELVHFALLLVTKPRRDDPSSQNHNQGRAVLKLLHLGLKALRATGENGGGGTTALTIPLNACNLLLAAMADTLESADHLDSAAAVADVSQIFVFLFGMATAETTTTTGPPSFNMYKPPTNVYATFMHRACSAAFALLAKSSLPTPTPTPTQQQRELVALVHAIVRVFQELQFSQLNKKKVFLAVAKTSFREIVGFRHALQQFQHIEGVDAVCQLLDRVVVDALFDSEHLREYEGALVYLRRWQNADHQEDSGAAAHKKHKKPRLKAGAKDTAASASSKSSLVSYQRHLFDELQAFLSDAAVALDVKQSIGSLMEVLVRGFSVRIRAAADDKIEDSRAELKTSKKRVANVIATTSTAYTPFKFWAELCGVAFCAFQAMRQETGHRDAASVMLVSVYDSLFKALCESDVYRVTEDTQEQDQFHMMQTILAQFVDFLRSDEYQTVADPTTTTSTSHVCSVISNAVRCTPNLVNSSLVAIFQVFGSCSFELEAASAAMVELLHAYESMRLIDSFLRSCCLTNDEDADAASELLSIFSHAATETTLRRTYMTLPPGQLEIVWRLLTDKLAVLCGSCDSHAVVPKVALVRSLFAVFLQEIHITPQNRAKIGELVVESHEKLLATLCARIARIQPKKSKKHGANDAFSTVERELFSVFGELLALYDGLSPGVRAQTLDVVLASLEPAFVPIMKSLLAGNDDQTVGAAAGIVKIGVHKLRRDASGSDVAALIVDRVVQWRCWDAVAFYLPELVNGIAEDKATALFVQLVQSFLGSDAAAERILRDAAFYEIAVLQKLAAQVFTNVTGAKHFADDRATVKKLFDYLQLIPSGYLDVAQPASRDLLAVVLDVHQSIAKLQDREGDSESLTSVALWIERYLVAIASASQDAFLRKDIGAWAEFLLLTSVSFDESSERLVQVSVTYLVRSSAADSALDKLLTKLLAKTSARGYATSATVLDAFARLQDKQHAASSTFVDQLIAKIKANPSIVTDLDSDASFQLLTALVKYVASSPAPETASTPTLQARRAKLTATMDTHVTSALAAAMQTIVQDETNSTASRYKFYATFCESFHLLRPAVSLETFSCLLAVALVLAGSSAENETRDRPLTCLVQHASKDEFHLLVATLLRELVVPSSERVLAALKALVFLLETDRKLSASRRQVLSDTKASFVGLFVQIFSRTLNQSDATLATALCVWNLRVFVLFYCKAELFTWKSHELLQVFAGFQPLVVISSQLNASENAVVWTPTQIHHVWLLSYTLLLRIVRHHFASLVNGIPHMVDALNALLRVLVGSSSSDTTTTAETSAYTLEWSSNLARLYGYLKPHGAALRKHVVYLLLTYLRGVTQCRLSLAVQQKLRIGIFSLLEICSQFEKEQLYASLDSTGKSLLKSLDTSYKLTYRYAGKV